MDQLIRKIKHDETTHTNNIKLINTFKSKLDSTTDKYNKLLKQNELIKLEVNTKTELLSDKEQICHKSKKDSEQIKSLLSRNEKQFNNKENAYKNEIRKKDQEIIQIKKKLQSLTSLSTSTVLNNNVSTKGGNSVNSNNNNSKICYAQFDVKNKIETKGTIYDHQQQTNSNNNNTSNNSFYNGIEEFNLMIEDNYTKATSDFQKRYENVLNAMIEINSYINDVIKKRNNEHLVVQKLIEKFSKSNSNSNDSSTNPTFLELKNEVFDLESKGFEEALLYNTQKLKNYLLMSDNAIGKFLEVLPEKQKLIECKVDSPKKIELYKLNQNYKECVLMQQELLQKLVHKESIINDNEGNNKEQNNNNINNNNNNEIKMIEEEQFDNDYNNNNNNINSKEFFDLSIAKINFEDNKKLVEKIKEKCLEYKEETDRTLNINITLFGNNNNNNNM